MKLRWLILLVVTALAALIIHPHSGVQAQETCTDAAGGPIPCPATDEPQEPVRRTPRPTVISATSTYTPTNTATSTITPSPTSTITITVTNLPPTNTATITPTSTPIPPQGAAVWMPGIGIGAFILFIIVGVLLPVVQKIRISLRE